MTGEHVLVFGGNGRIARPMTSVMLSQSWKVTSVIRSLHQTKSLLELGKNQPGRAEMCVENGVNCFEGEDIERILNLYR
jgi:nucleoside-diphosphate-sugar epimerase